jgi:hypothetical protein
VIEAILAASQEHYAGPYLQQWRICKIYASQKEFRDKNYLYHRAADYEYDTTMLTLRRKP